MYKQIKYHRFNISIQKKNLKSNDQWKEALPESLNFGQHTPKPISVAGPGRSRGEMGLS